MKKWYKMYKSGKMWLFVGIMFVMLNMNVVMGWVDELIYVEVLIELVVVILFEGNVE